jgi:hypothetical protein
VLRFTLGADVVLFLMFMTFRQRDDIKCLATDLMMDGEDSSNNGNVACAKRMTFFQALAQKIVVLRMIDSND